MHENQDSEYLRCQRAGERLVSKMDPGPFSGQKQRWKAPRGPLAGHLGGLYSRSYLSSSAAVYSHFKISVFYATVTGPRLHLRHLQPCLCIKDRTYLPSTNSSVIQRSVVSTAQSNILLSVHVR